MSENFPDVQADSNVSLIEDDDPVRDEVNGEEVFATARSLLDDMRDIQVDQIKNATYWESMLDKFLACYHEIEYLERLVEDEALHPDFYADLHDAVLCMQGAYERMAYTLVSQKKISIQPESIG